MSLSCADDWTVFRLRWNWPRRVYARYLCPRSCTASLTASIAITVPGVSVSGNVKLAINTTGAAHLLGTTTLPAGPYLRVDVTTGARATVVAGDRFLPPTDDYPGGTGLAYWAPR